MAAEKAKLIILISGSGSNLQAFIDQCQSGELNAEIVCVMSNKAEAYGLQRAQDAGIGTQVVDHTLYDSRESFDQALAAEISAYEPDLVILAGFMRILTADFVSQFSGRLLNIHPSLLPKYPGLNTHHRAIESGDPEAGATVHYVTAELDGGPPILQASVDIAADDDAQSLAKKVLEKEHIIYPLTVQWFIQGRLELKEDGAYLDKEKLPSSGRHFAE